MKKINVIVLITMLALLMISAGIPASAQEGTGTPALAQAAPCIPAPYGWQYQDDMRSIAINKFSENGITYFVADVQLANASSFQTSYTDNAAPVSDLANKAGAVLAINGDDFGTHKYGVIIRNGQLLRTHDTTRNLLVVDAQGNMSIKTDRQNEDYAALGQQLQSAGALQAFEFGPELVKDGQAVEFSNSFDLISTRSSRLEPRTAIGQIGPLHYIIIVVDGRQDGYSVGISLQDLQQLFIKYGAKTAMNLDGGGSAEMWFQGQILNQPSGGVERSVSDILFF